VSRAQGEPLRIAVLISGGGTTLRNILESIDQGRLNARVVLVVSSRSDAGGLAHAREAGVRVEVVRQDESGSVDQFTEQVFEPCREAGAELVVMGGYLKHVLIPADFENRVINIHPSLIPAYCGQGFYGQRVHEAVLEAGELLRGLFDEVLNDVLVTEKVRALHGVVAVKLEIVVFPCDGGGSTFRRNGVAPHGIDLGHHPDRDLRIGFDGGDCRAQAGSASADDHDVMA